ncbi:MAG: hypothetical protein ACRCXZ_06480, partial [Patescibacteria group bacterium]
DVLKIENNKINFVTKADSDKVCDFKASRYNINTDEIKTLTKEELMDSEFVNLSYQDLYNGSVNLTDPDGFEFNYYNRGFNGFFSIFVINDNISYAENPQLYKNGVSKKLINVSPKSYRFLGFLKKK